MLVLELLTVLVLPTKKIPDQAGIQTSIHVFDLPCGFGSCMGLHLWNVSQKKVNTYFLDFLFIQTWCLNSSLTAGISHLAVCRGHLKCLYGMFR